MLNISIKKIYTTYLIILVITFSFNSIPSLYLPPRLPQGYPKVHPNSFIDVRAMGGL